MGGCNWKCELTQYLSNICQMYWIYAIHGASALLKNTVSIEEWMAPTTLVK